MTTRTGIGSVWAACFGATLATTSFGLLTWVTTAWPCSKLTNAWLRTSLASAVGLRTSSISRRSPARRVPSVQTTSLTVCPGWVSGFGSARTNCAVAGIGLRTATL